MRNSLRIAISFALGIIAGMALIGRFTGEMALWMKDMSDKHLKLFLLLNQWMIVKQNGKSLDQYLNEQGIKTIAIYGMSYVGERLYYELKDTDITVAYAIDKKSNEILSDLKIYNPDEEFEETDAIIVTTIASFDAVRNNLSVKTRSRIMSLEDILYDI